MHNASSSNAPAFFRASLHCRCCAAAVDYPRCCNKQTNGQTHNQLHAFRDGRDHVTGTGLLGAKSFLFGKSFPLQSFFVFSRTDYMIPQTFTVTSKHIRFYFLVFLFYTFSCRFRAVD